MTEKDPSTQVEWRVGTMGFGYADWRGVFYPKPLKSGDYLRFYAQQLNAVEIDSTFHAAPEPARFARWAQAVPDDFRFSVKTPRAITHEAVIADTVGAMRSFVSAARELGNKLAVVLIQYPPHLPGRVWPQVERFLDALPGDVRYAVEFRHPTFFRDEVIDALAQRGIALVNAEYEHAPAMPVATAEFGYLRLIGVHGRYEPMNYERADMTERLVWWRDQMLAQPHVRTVYCMFNNDYAGFSIATADRFRKLIGQNVASQQERLGVLF